MTPRRDARLLAGLGAAGAALVVCLVALRPPLVDGYGLSSAVYDRHGKLLRLSLAADERYRLPVTLDEVAPVLVEATLLHEDRWFFTHPGVNPWSLVRAAVGTALGGPRRGASTISMQLARLRFGIDSSDVGGKLVQIARAMQLEAGYTKRELFEAYLTLAPYGGNVEGVAAAARIYFDKTPADLTLAEALALAVMPQRPNARAPGADGLEPPALREARQRLAREYLAAHPEITPAEAGLGAPLVMGRRRDLPFLAPHLAAHLGHGGSVTTTLDLGLQALIERRVRETTSRRQADGIDNAAVLLVDHRTMEVLAVVGSADFGDAAIAGQVDGTRARRSPGSALKPFVYALALEAGLIHPRTVLKDAPLRLGAYSPENFDGSFQGPVSATEALVRSRNVPAVALDAELRRLAAARGTGEVGGLYDLLAQAGIRDLFPAEHYGLAVVLGGVEVSMEEVVALYAMLARGGELAPLRYTLAAPTPASRQLLTPEAAALTLDMLVADDSAVGLSAAALLRDGTPVAWKTGTSYGFRDAWTVGVVGPWVLGVWVGRFDSRGNPAFVGRWAAAPLFFDIVSGLRPRLASAREPPRTLDLAEVEVCALSGGIPTPACPRTVRTRFIPGVSPIARCDVHREVRLDLATGLRACPGELEGTVARVFEFWPSDLAKLFTQAGLPRVRPPPYLARCGIEARADLGRPPSITSPQPGVVYSLRAARLGEETIPFSAATDADVEVLRWFVGDELVGTTPRDQPLFWPARPGDFVVRALDDSGRADVQTMQVAVVP